MIAEHDRPARGGKHRPLHLRLLEMGVGEAALGIDPGAAEIGAVGVDLAEEKRAERRDQRTGAGVASRLLQRSAGDHDGHATVRLERDRDVDDLEAPLSTLRSALLAWDVETVGADTTLAAAPRVTPAPLARSMVEALALPMLDDRAAPLDHGHVTYAAPGMVASKTLVPVLGVPVPATMLQGVDALLSIVQMPAGVPVGTLAIGRPGATNAAILAAEIVGLRDGAVRERLRAWRESRAATVRATELPLLERPETGASSPQGAR